MKRKKETELKEIKGDVVSKLCAGSKIVWLKHDGYDWHMVLEHPKGSEWKFGYYETLNEYSDNKFCLMVNYNQTKFQTLKVVSKEYYEDMFHKKRMAEKKNKKA